MMLGRIVDMLTVHEVLAESHLLGRVLLAAQKQAVLEVASQC